MCINLFMFITETANGSHDLRYAHLVRLMIVKVLNRLIIDRTRSALKVNHTYVNCIEKEIDNNLLTTQRSSAQVKN